MLTVRLYIILKLVMVVGILIVYLLNVFGRLKTLM